MRERPIKIAITALGGQGGGVLADWIVAVGEKAGYIAQSTSVPGVAQRTGATVYYIELFPESAAKAKGKRPVLALMPFPGDVDIVLAMELMEAGRAIARGFVSGETTLIASSHRDYAIGEKIALSDGRKGGDTILRAAERAAGRFIIADMQSEANSAGAVVSAVMLGALAGAGALPIACETFESAIRETGRAVENNLAGFAAGRAAVERQSTDPSASGRKSRRAAAPPSEKVKNVFPLQVQEIIGEGLRRAADFQDSRYGGLYLRRLEEILASDQANGGEAREWRLTAAVAKHLALWMSYEDAIRVADLKTRRSRFARVREDVRAEDGQIVHLSEYMHPRIEEVCDLLPTPLAQSILSAPALRNAIDKVVGKGRRVSTTKLRGYVPLRFLASLRPLRRGTYRFGIENSRIESWLSAVKTAAEQDYALACEIAVLQRLLKGYGETHERGLGNYTRIIEALDVIRRQDDPAGALARLRDAALSDENGISLRAALKRLDAAAA